MKQAKPFFTRKLDLLTKSPNLESLYQFSKFPIFIGATEQARSEDICSDMQWDIGIDTGMIQLRSLLDPKLVYSGYHSEAIGGVWERHHREFAAFVRDMAGETILEVGGANGHLANLVLTASQEVKSYKIIEPNPNCRPNKRLEVLKGFFTKQFAKKNEIVVDTAIHSHTFEHFYDPADLLDGIEEILPDGGMHIFSIPDLEGYLKSGFTNTLNFEHTFYLTNDVVEYMLAKRGFRVISRRKFESHSIFYATIKDKSVDRNVSLVNRYSENKKTFLDFIKSYESMIEDFNVRISESEGAVYLFGAHVFSQFLINMGICESKITGVLDNSTIKRGKRLYGTSLQIFDPSEIEGQANVTVILKAGQYQDEVRAQLLRINPNCLILE